MKELRFTIPGPPRTKKNHQRIISVGGRPRVIPSKDYEQYESAALWRLPRLRKPVEEPVNLCCVYYMPTRRRVDLVNLLEATNDILVRGGVLADDHCGIVASHDGSRVRVDRENPRAEITITGVDPEPQKNYGAPCKSHGA